VVDARPGNPAARARGPGSFVARLAHLFSAQPGVRMPQVMDQDDIRRALHRIAHEITEQTEGAGNIVLIGIHTRGVPLANRIREAIGSFEEIWVPVGTLDIGLYRDDLADRPVTSLAKTSLPVDISGRTVVLVDDVLYTGRTVRAALDALADFGRPAAVRLAVLVDRGHRQLPIRPDFVGKNLPTAANERVSVQLDPVDGDEGVWIDVKEGP
jgi:pyrimidine operon attenuation protein/uracil phosphoribosyltransferase